MKETIELNGREVIILHPEKPNGKWAIKTEYFEAFPAVQDTLLNMGYYIAHIKNITRWHDPSDTDARAELCKYMSERFNLGKCVIIGMSCGGMQGIYFASKYPELVSVLYLDAPVVNFLSCPAGLGKKTSASYYDEFYQHTGIDISTLLSYRNHPLDHLPNLVKHNIPVILVSGDSDTIVPYDENGKLIDDIYTANNCIIKTIIKKGADHHPHSLEDNTPIIDFILKYDN